jgi:site-specific recombinase XerC
MGLRKNQTNSTSFKKGIIPWMKGKTHSEETRDKLSLSHIGKKLSRESIQKRTETRRKLYLEGKLVGSMKGKHQSE